MFFGLKENPVLWACCCVGVLLSLNSSSLSGNLRANNPHDLAPLEPFVSHVGVSGTHVRIFIADSHTKVCCHGASLASVGFLLCPTLSYFLAYPYICIQREMHPSPDKHRVDVWDSPPVYLVWPGEHGFFCFHAVTSALYPSCPNYLPSKVSLTPNNWSNN